MSTRVNWQPLTKTTDLTTRPSVERGAGICWWIQPSTCCELIPARMGWLHRRHCATCRDTDGAAGRQELKDGFVSDSGCRIGQHLYAVIQQSGFLPRLQAHCQCRHVTPTSRSHASHLDSVLVHLRTVHTTACAETPWQAASNKLHSVLIAQQSRCPIAIKS